MSCCGVFRNCIINDDTVKLLEREIETHLKAEVVTDTDSAAKAGIYLQLGDILSSKYCYLGSFSYYLKAFNAYMRAADIKGACGSLTAFGCCRCL